MPDLRVEFDESKTYLTVSWPLPHLDGYYLIGSELEDGDDIWPTVFLEPQWRPADGGLRFLTGGRFRHSALPLFVETGGLVRTDGHGGFAGIGITARRDPRSGLLSLVYRHTWTTEDRRHDRSRSTSCSSCSKRLCADSR